jgi:hypothetical protein
MGIMRGGRSRFSISEVDAEVGCGRWSLLAESGCCVAEKKYLDDP